MTKFEKELRDLLNRHSMENGSDTADWLLARYLCGCLKLFDATIKTREASYREEIASKNQLVS